MYLNESNMYMSNKKYDENTGYFTESGLDISDPMYMQELLLEEERAWHELEISMIKCEHTAIVSEDSALLEAADDDFKTKARKFFEDFGQQFLRYVDSVINKWTEIQLKIMSRTKNLDKMKKYIETKFKNRYNKTKGKKNQINNLTIDVDEMAIAVGRTLAKQKSSIVTMINVFESSLTSIKRTFDNSDQSSINRNINSFGGDVGMTKNDNFITPQKKRKKLTDAEVKINEIWSSIFSKSGLGRDADGDFRKYRTDKRMSIRQLVLTEKKDRDYITTEIIPFARDERKTAIEVLKYFRKIGAKILNLSITYAKNNDGDSDEIKVAKKTVTDFKQKCNDFIIIINKATLSALKAINKVIKIVKKPSKESSSIKQNIKTGVNYERGTKGDKFTRAASYSVLDDFM